MVRNVDNEQALFKATFGTKSMTEKFNRPALMYLQGHIKDLIGDEKKAEDALKKINKLVEQSQV